MTASNVIARHIARARGRHYPGCGCSFARMLFSRPPVRCVVCGRERTHDRVRRTPEGYACRIHDEDLVR